MQEQEDEFTQTFFLTVWNTLGKNMPYVVFLVRAWRWQFVQNYELQLNTWPFEWKFGCAGDNTITSQKIIFST